MPSKQHICVKLQNSEIQKIKNARDNVKKSRQTGLRMMLCNAPSALNVDRTVAVPHSRKVSTELPKPSMRPADSPTYWKILEDLKRFEKELIAPGCLRPPQALAKQLFFPPNFNSHDAKKASTSKKPNNPNSDISPTFKWIDSRHWGIGKKFQKL